MAFVDKSVLLPYSAEQMFALVNNVSDYPLFLPWCGGASVAVVGENTTHATIHINYLQIKQSFTTENVLHSPNNIAMTLKDGPFRNLDGNWHFTALSPSACKIDFKLHYEFSSKLLEKVLGPVFHFVANSFVDAFTHRAEKVYVANE
jgi:ribosome-associated toxin RatA of RatAB toxin-antitoxin module